MLSLLLNFNWIAGSNSLSPVISWIKKWARQNCFYFWGGLHKISFNIFFLSALKKRAKNIRLTTYVNFCDYFNIVSTINFLKFLIEKIYYLKKNISESGYLQCSKMCICWEWVVWILYMCSLKTILKNIYGDFSVLEKLQSYNRNKLLTFGFFLFKKIGGHSEKEIFTELEIFLLSSIYIRRKYWIRENFRLPVFDGFTCFEMSWTRFDHF